MAFVLVFIVGPRGGVCRPPHQRTHLTQHKAQQAFPLPRRLFFLLRQLYLRQFSACLRRSEQDWRQKGEGEVQK